MNAVMNSIAFLSAGATIFAVIGWCVAKAESRNAKCVMRNLSRATDIALERAMLYLTADIESWLDNSTATDIKFAVMRGEYRKRLDDLQRVGIECVKRGVILQDDLRVVITDFRLPAAFTRGNEL